MTRDQSLKPCAGGCGKQVRGKRCMDCFRKIPARERSGWYGKFQLHPSHLITNQPDTDTETEDDD